MALVKEELSLQNQEILYNHYGVDLFQRVSSPLRDEDNPSFSTYELNGMIKWKDFGTGQGGNIYSFIMEYEGVDFPEAVIIANDILDGSSNDINSYKQTHKKNIQRGVILSNVFRDFELSYWLKRGISENQLVRNKVFPLKMLTINGRFKCTSMSTNPKFAYILGNDSWKIYSPLDSGEFKWISNNLSHINYESEPFQEYDDLMILSSKKDKMVFDNLGLPYDTTSVLSESNYIGIINELNGKFSKYKNIYCLLDFDTAGEQATKNIELKSNGRVKGVYPQLNMLNFLHTKSIKDIDDVFIKFGRDNLLKLIKKLL